MNKIIAFVLLVVFFFFIFSCNSEDETSCNSKGVTYSYPKFVFKESIPLDSIYGDKIINVKTNEVRYNNFEKLIGMDKEYILSDNLVYKIQMIDSNHFIMSPKKSYEIARNFNILLKTDSVKIVDFTVFNDFSISDIKREDTNWILLLSDFNQTNKYWVSEQQIKIVKLDENLNELWSYNNNRDVPFNGNSIAIKDDGYEFNIEIMTGCHICIINASFLLSKEGNFLSVKKIGVQNSADISDSELQKLFK